MKVEKKADHTALSALSRQMAGQSESSEFKKIFTAMSEAEDALEQMETVADRLKEAEKVGEGEVVIHKKFLPDGSIEIIETKDGKVVERHKKKPHLVPVADPTKPAGPDGKPQMKLEPHQSIAELLMMM